MSITSTTPNADEYAPHYAAYIQQSVKQDMRAELANQALAFPDYLKTIPEEKQNYRYRSDKWTVKEVVGHIIETERIMAYRALCISRNDQTPLPGFEQNSYVAAVDYDPRSITDLAEEFQAVRASNLFLFRSFNKDVLLRRGTASGYAVSVRALLYIISGHLKHHWRILEERYLL